MCVGKLYARYGNFENNATIIFGYVKFWFKDRKGLLTQGLEIGVSEGQRNMHFLKVYPPISIQLSQLPHQPTNLNK